MTKEVNPVKERFTILKSAVDYMIKKGMDSAICESELERFSPNDVGIIQNYCNELGYQVSYKNEYRKNMSITGCLVLKPYTKPPDPDQGIEISVSEYNFLKFCRNNGFCKLLYKFLGKME